MFAIHLLPFNLTNKHRLKRLPPFRYTFSYCAYICNKRKIFFCPKESIFTPLEMKSPSLRMYVQRTSRRKNNRCLGTCNSSLHRNGPQIAGPSASLDHAQQISVISLVSGITKKCFLRKESFLTEEFQNVYIGTPHPGSRALPLLH